MADGVQNRLHGLVSDELFATLQNTSPRRIVVTLLQIYRYFHGKFSGRLHSLVPPVPNFTAKTRHATHVVANSLIPFSLHWCDISSIQAASSHEPLLSGTESQEDSSSITKIPPVQV